MKQDWTKVTCSLSSLRKAAFEHRHLNNIFNWLKAIGLVPDDVDRMYVVLPRLGLPANDIPVGYLAATAYEWDSWGSSSPVDFVKAIECEVEGGKRDVVVEALEELQTMAERRRMSEFFEAAGVAA